jgi:TetR/AcrR family transcriptional regulator, cholesterol catabolism regulator
MKTPRATLPGRRERKRQAVQARIREAARDLFREQGYDATTVQEIAERADVGKGTFFNYFPRKDAVLVSLAEEMFSELFESLGPPEEWHGTALDQTRRLFLGMATIVERDPPLLKVMLIEKLRSFWLRTSDDPLEQRFRGLCHDVLARGVERGEFMGAPDLPVATKLLEAAWFTALLEWLRNGAKGGFKEELGARLVVLFRGFGSVDLRGEGGSG